MVKTDELLEIGITSGSQELYGKWMGYNLRTANCRDLKAVWLNDLFRQLPFNVIDERPETIRQTCLSPRTRAH